MDGDAIRAYIIIALGCVFVAIAILSYVFGNDDDDHFWR